MIPQILEHTSDYFWSSAIFAIGALIFAAYLMKKDKQPIWSVRNVPNLLVLLSILGGGYLAFSSGHEVAELHARTNNIEELQRIEERYGRWAKLPASGYSLNRTDL